MIELETLPTHKVKLDLEKDQILFDYKIVQQSRQASLMGRKEVFMGKAKFGIFGDGKELAQVVMARYFKKGDWRSGYYRDQTFMLAIEELKLQEYFAQLYAHTVVEEEPASGGRLMNGHFATRSLNEDGTWKDIRNTKNSGGDISPTAGQVPRLIGLGYASKLFKENEALQRLEQFKGLGKEIAWGTIGNASCAEGMFLETINAAGVLQIPLVLSVWDDDYGISVPNEFQTTKGSISEALAGYQRTEEKPGVEIIVAKGWDYESLHAAYRKAETLAREASVPSLVHVIEMTQPQGHSTSGSHERYKSKERLQWEADHDCNMMFRSYILENGLATEEELDEIDKEAVRFVREQKDKAWKSFTEDIKSDLKTVVGLIKEAAGQSKQQNALNQLADDLAKTLNPIRKDVFGAVRKTLLLMRFDAEEARGPLKAWYEEQKKRNYDRYNSHLYSESEEGSQHVQVIAPVYTEQSPTVDGREVLQACFDQMLSNDPRVFAFGEDVGKIGDVNQAFAGLQEKHGELRVTDTGIREMTIIGQGIGTALRGLRPIAEIQYLDYIYYALMTLTDDLACLHYRTKGGQKAPMIVRTRGHRLEGVWHSGSPMSAILGSLRGLLVCVPRNMTQAAGMYNTLLRSDEPALMIECLNAYRQKELMPTNVGEFTVPLGRPEVLREGTDITVVTYGAMCRIVLDAAEQLVEYGVSVEVIDVQTLLPFDVDHVILESIKKTSRVIFADEDVPGGASAYMMQQVLEKQKAYYQLDSEPVTLSAQPHRPAYSSDGDYFSKPSVDDVIEKAYLIMHEVDPISYPMW
ncbi:alpha-ketoacid dehydrogenase subunit alpha/beta [Echinicola vietnamensis]|uniref:3-methyl-2-oxobutanoate dehydrogenase (2-methylpropanoyl-transferring) n=1 Tax=Echinicola vietnamensis (strain DSM 17526 / LMG 23754 / KMM 6221) TaxID=926556 RepID=L0FUS4_ECHVK|nr:alpha-ketoacid dehydrogenase subunit alpha/beta [Echinicola vietnamensis]AGA76496.1 pyruvate/2-oxoglutarate dehydrogenase complex, dehydrogenase component beta subunit [Echinicola vietnamensis DSM 17526]